MYYTCFINYRLYSRYNNHTISNKTTLPGPPPPPESTATPTPPALLNIPTASYASGIEFISHMTSFPDRLFPQTDYYARNHDTSPSGCFRNLHNLSPFATASTTSFHVLGLISGFRVTERLAQCSTKSAPRC